MAWTAGFILLEAISKPLWLTPDFAKCPFGLISIATIVAAVEEYTITFFWEGAYVNAAMIIRLAVRCFIGFNPSGCLEFV